MSRIIDGLTQYFDEDGKMLSGGKLYFYETGSTTTLKSIYSDIGEASAITNPQTLDSEGRLQSDIFGTGAYNVRLYKVNSDLTETLIDEADPMGDASGAQFSTWNSLTTYDSNSLVTGSDGNYYQSLTTSNINNDPTSDATKWQQIEFIYYYNENRTYAANDRVRDSSGNIYVSLAAANLNNTPSSSPLKWAKINGKSNITLTADPSAANVALYQQHNMPVFNNTGAGIAVNVPLPAAVVGLKFGGYIDAAQYLKMTCNGTEVITTALETTAAGGYVRNNTPYLYWEIECFETGIWALTKINDILLYDE